jgi:hypothetical protein
LFGASPKGIIVFDAGGRYSKYKFVLVVRDSKPITTWRVRPK